MEDIFLTVVLPLGIFAIVFGCIYKVFELIIGRKERTMLIEKLQPEQLSHGVAGHLKAPSFYTTLRTGCLVLGIGLGLIAGYCFDPHTSYEESSIIYAASTLIGGGIGLISAFLVELKLNKKKEEQDERRTR